jgi:hypothetical protein
MRWIPDLWPQLQIRGHNSGWVYSTRDETFKRIVLRPRCQMATWSDDWKYFITYLQINKVSTAVAKQFDRWLKVNYNLFGLWSYFLVAIWHLGHMIEMQKKINFDQVFFDLQTCKTRILIMWKIGILISWTKAFWSCEIRSHHHFLYLFCYCFERIGHSIDFYQRNY